MADSFRVGIGDVPAGAASRAEAGYELRHPQKR